MKELELTSTEICEKLISEERTHRYKTLKRLEDFFENIETSDENIKLIYEDCYLHILKCYSDKFENCRELACNVITSAITRLPKNDYYLQYIVTTICGRIGKKEIIENSEELRLEFLKQLHFLIIKYSTDIEDIKIPDLLIKSYNEIIEIILKTLTDSYPAIQKEACFCLKALALGTRAFHYRADVLAKPLYPMLRHKHSHNRIAAIESLGIVCIHIRNSDLIVEIIMEVSPLLMDPMPLVRLECGKVGCNWLLNLLDRYSYFERILPLALCCLKDDSPDVRSKIDKEWKKCGKQFYDENESEMNTLEVIDENPENYPNDIARPTLGCRGLVQKALRVYKLIMRESSDWKDDVRLHSMKLMYQFVLHAEQKLTAFVFEFYGDLAKACADSVKEVANEALKVADLIGRLIKYDNWIQHAIDNLQKHSKLGYLKCFYSIYSSTTILNIDDILKITKIIASNEFSNNIRPEFQEYLLKLSQELWKRTCSNNNNQSFETAMDNLNLNSHEIEKNLYHVIIKVMSLSFDEKHGSQVYDFGKKVLLELANCDKLKIRILHGEHLVSVLETFDCLDAEIDDHTEPILLLHGVIRICEYNKNYLKILKKCILTVWENALPDGKIKIFSAVSIAMLNWSKTIDLVGDDSVDVLRSFANDIIVPHLKWKAGASAESMRSFATATLCSMTQGAKDAAIKILPELATYYPSLIEDNSSSTRCYALKCFINFGEVKLENLKPIGYAVLQRLDDPCSEIREWAGRVICRLKPLEQDMAENEIVIWNDFIKYSFSMLFIHFDGPELKLRNCVKESLVILGKQYPEIFKEKYQEALLNFTNKEELMEVDMLVLQETHNLN